MLKKQLIRDEGDVPYACQGSLGYWTTGVGLLIDKRKGGGLPDSVRDFWLDYESETKHTQLEERLPWANQPNPARKDCLLNMAFKLGIGGLLNFKKTLALIAAGKYADVACEMLDSSWARQVGERALRLSEQMEGGGYA